MNSSSSDLHCWVIWVSEKGNRIEAAAGVKNIWTGSHCLHDIWLVSLCLILLLLSYSFISRACCSSTWLFSVSHDDGGQCHCVPGSYQDLSWLTCHYVSHTHSQLTSSSALILVNCSWGLIAKPSFDGSCTQTIWTFKQSLLSVNISWFHELTEMQTQWGVVQCTGIKHSSHTSHSCWSTSWHQPSSTKKSHTTMIAQERGNIFR